MAADCDGIDEERSVGLEFLTVQEDSLAPRKPNEACDNSSSDEGDSSEYEAEETSCFTSERPSKPSFLLGKMRRKVRHFQLCHQYLWLYQEQYCSLLQSQV